VTETVPEYRIYAIRYASRDAQRRDHFLMGDPHEGDMPMDYFVWAIVGPDETIVVDLGFTEETAIERKRDFYRCPIDTLNEIGVDPADVKTVILTHMHYDHVGNFDKLPNAQFHLQEPEIHFAVGRHMRNDFLAHPFNVDDVVGVVRLNYKKRVTFYDGPAKIAPGITVTPVGGHSVGLQFVTVETADGPVILASDVTHFYENIESRRLFPAVVSATDMFDAYDAVEAAAGKNGVIVPGHDPQVMTRYSSDSPALEGIAVRVDRKPVLKSQ